MTASAAKLPRFVPLFPELRDRGISKALVRVYGAVVAFDSMGYVATCVDIARAADYSLSGDNALRVRRMLRDLVRLGLVDRVFHSPSCTRYVPRGPTMVAPLLPHMAPANDNGRTP